MTAAQFEALEEAEAVDVIRWRLFQLTSERLPARGGGYGRDAAGRRSPPGVGSGRARVPARARAANPSLEQAELAATLDSLGAGRDVELAVDRARVRLDGVEREVERGGDLAQRELGRAAAAGRRARGRRGRRRSAGAARAGGRGVRARPSRSARAVVRGRDSPRAWPAPRQAWPGRAVATPRPRSAAATSTGAAPRRASVTARSSASASASRRP